MGSWAEQGSGDRIRISSFFQHEQAGESGASESVRANKRVTLLRTAEEPVGDGVSVRRSRVDREGRLEDACLAMRVHACRISLQGARLPFPLMKRRKKRMATSVSSSLIFG